MIPALRVLTIAILTIIGSVTLYFQSYYDKVSDVSSSPVISANTTLANTTTNTTANVTEINQTKPWIPKLPIWDLAKPISDKISEFISKLYPEGKKAPPQVGFLILCIVVVGLLYLVLKGFVKTIINILFLSLILLVVLLAVFIALSLAGVI